MHHRDCPRASRRQFLQSTFCATVGTWTASSVSARAGADVPVRVNVNSLTAGSPVIQTYANAVKEMKARSAVNPLDPLGWKFWGNIHWRLPGESNTHPAWSQCHHGSRWFYPWHRGYLLFFERAIRKVSGDSAFTLPYWKWDAPESRAVPVLFRNNEDPVLRELFHPRNSWVNAGEPLPAEPFEVDLVNCLAQASYDQQEDGQGFNQSMDFSPHGSVHVDVGGDMGSVPTAARDPVFYLHHVNVDRLWNRWLSQPGRVNPADSVWLGPPQGDDGSPRKMMFPDENGAIVEFTTKEVLEMAGPAYRYDDDPAAPASPPIFALRAQGASQPPPVRATAGSASKGSFALTNEKSVVTVPLGTSGATRLKTAMRRFSAAPAGPERPARVFIDLQGIQVAGAQPAIRYSIYVRPKNAPAEEKGEYVGTLHFFDAPHDQHGGQEHAAGVAPKYDRRFDVSKALQKLTENGQRNLDELEVVFLPSRQPEGGPAVQGVSFERLAVQTVQR